MKIARKNMAVSLLKLASLTVFLLLPYTSAQHHTVSVDLEHASRTVSDQFLSVTIDSNSIKYNLYNLDLKSERMINIAKALAPAMLRVGGTEQDFLVFSKKEEHDYQNYTVEQEVKDNQKNFTMSASQWDTINQYVQAAGWDIVFGLNVFLRTSWPRGDWDTTNAEQLMNYTISKGYKVNWELGNEPNRFPEVNNSINVSASQLAKDFATLKDLVGKLNMKPNYIAGPDIAGGGDNYLTEFLKEITPNVINAVTWHQYYENGATALFPDFFNPEILDKFAVEANNTVNIVTQQRQLDVELWLGETSSCYGGGAPGLSDTYLAGFMWLDKLGLAAIINQTRVFRQAFIAREYGLLDTNSIPLPDFWLSAIYKKLVGHTVLHVHNSTQPGRHVRVYAHCANAPLYSPGTVVLIMLNLNTFNSSVMLTDETLASSRRDVFWLTPPGGVQNILSKQVTLNGRLLELVNNSTIPDLFPTEQQPSSELQIPTLSFGFYVFKDAKARACMPS